MTQLEVKQKLVEAYIKDVETEGTEEPTNYCEDLFHAISKLYVHGLITGKFYYAINNFYYGAEISEWAYEKRPDLFVRLSAKNKEA